MLPIVLVTAISFLFNDSVEQNKREYEKKLNFGFHEGGKYNFKIKHGGNDSYLFIIQTENIINKYLEKQDMFHPCDVNTSNQNFHFIQLKNGQANFSGKTHQKGLYNIQIMSCTYFHEGCSYEVSFINPNSYISSTEEPYMKICFIPVFAVILLYALWIINWFFCFSCQNIIHLFLTFGFLTYAIDKYILLLIFKERYQSDLPSKYTKIHLYMFAYYSFLINFSIILLYRCGKKSVREYFFLA